MRSEEPDFSPLDQLLALSPEQLAGALDLEQLQAVLTLVDDRIAAIRGVTVVPATEEAPAAETSIRAQPRSSERAAETVPLQPLAQPLFKKSRWDSDSDDGAKRKKKKKSKQVAAPPPSSSTLKQAEPGTRPLDEYEMGPPIGEGTFGKVMSATDKVRLVRVALKCVKLNQDAELSFPCWAKMELNFLFHLRHDNLVRLLDVVLGPQTLQGLPSLYFSMELFDLGDLRTFFDSYALEDDDVESRRQLQRHIIRSVLRALEFLHSHNIVHRDVKTSNVLLNSQGRVALGDLGSARVLPGTRPGSPQITTLHYRAPEMLVGLNYDFKVDMWGVGCIYAEVLMGGKVLFPGESEVEQLRVVFSTLGVPLLPSYVSSLEGVDRGSLSLPEAEASQMDLILDFLEIDPARRASATVALQNPVLGLR